MGFLLLLSKISRIYRSRLNYNDVTYVIEHVTYHTVIYYFVIVKAVKYLILCLDITWMQEFTLTKLSKL